MSGMKNWRSLKVMDLMCNIMSTWAIRDQRYVLCNVPMDKLVKGAPIFTTPATDSWIPKEVGIVIARLMDEEEDPDILCALLIQLIKFDFSTPDRVELGGEGYMALARELISSSLSGSPTMCDWDDTDVGWIAKVVCYELGVWACRKWEDYREEAHMVWLADLFAQIAIRRNLLPHDYKVIQELMDVTTPNWPLPMCDELARIIELRFKVKNRTFFRRQFSKVLRFIGRPSEHQKSDDDVFPIPGGGRPRSKYIPKDLL